ncbi:MAG: hypothetical protein K8R23_09760 [Chthoniobacter sp.]|nr:hypothetical protein [Chthoniobacter sp.]
MKLRIQKHSVLVAVVCATIWLSAAGLNAQTVYNFDFLDVGETPHALDNGVFSSTGGSIWNSVTPLGGATNVLDQFGAVTPLSISFDGSPIALTGLGTANALQSSGLRDSDTLIHNLSLQPYDIALYLTGGSYINIQHNGGLSNVRSTTTNTGLLPGVEGQDYVLFSNVIPYEIVPGDYGFSLGAPDGAITGAQIRSAQAVTQPITHAYGNWNVSDHSTTPLQDSGSVDDSLVAGYDVTVTVDHTDPPVVRKAQGTSGLNFFGGGSMGAKAGINQVGTHSTEEGLVPTGGAVRATSGYVSAFRPVGATTPFDLDLHFELDGILDLLGVTDALADITNAEAHVGVEISASVRSQFQAEKTVLKSRVYFYGNDSTMQFVDDEPGALLNTGNMSGTYAEYVDAFGGHTGGHYDFSLISDLEDVLTLVPGEYAWLSFELTAIADIDLYPSEPIQFAMSDFLHTLGGSVSSDTPGVTFESTPTPEPSSLLLMASAAPLLLRRRR